MMSISSQASNDDDAAKKWHPSCHRKKKDFGINIMKMNLESFGFTNLPKKEIFLKINNSEGKSKKKSN